MKRISWVFVLMAIFLSLSASASGAATDRAWAVFESKKDRRVEVRVSGGRIFITGTNTDTVKVSAWAEDDDADVVSEPEEDPRAAGLRRITHGASGLELWEEDNVVTIKTKPFASDLDVHITVPRDVEIDVIGQFADSIVVRNINRDVRARAHGSIRLEHIKGDVEVRTGSGWIFLDGVSGGVVANSQFGGIEGSLDSVDPEKPVYLSASGHIDVTLPAKTKATLHMKTSFGEVFTDFDMKVSPKTASRAPSVLSVGQRADGDGYAFYVYGRGDDIDPGADRDDEDDAEGEDAGKDDKDEKSSRESKRATERSRVRVVTKGDAFVYVTPPTAPVVMIPDPAAPAVPYGSSRVGKLNGGGAEIRLTTMSGNIYVRKLKSGKK